MFTVDFIAEGFVRKENAHSLPEIGDIIYLPEKVKNISTGDSETVQFKFKVAQIKYRIRNIGWVHYNVFCNRVLPDGSVREVYPTEYSISAY